MHDGDVDGLSRECAEKQWKDAEMSGMRVTDFEVVGPALMRALRLCLKKRLKSSGGLVEAGPMTSVVDTEVSS